MDRYKKNYHEFLLKLWQMTRDLGGFPSYAAIIKKYKVNKSVSVVLRELEWVTADGKLYEWKRKKPTRNDAYMLDIAIKQYLLSRKFLNKDMEEIVEKTAEDITSIGVAIDSIDECSCEETDTCDTGVKMPYSEKELNNDVNVALNTSLEEAAEQLKSQEIDNLKNEVAVLKSELDNADGRYKMLHELSTAELEEYKNKITYYENRFIELTVQNTLLHENAGKDSALITELKSGLDYHYNESVAQTKTIAEQRDEIIKLRAENKVFKSSWCYKLKTLLT